MANRTARVERVTKETQVLVELDLDGAGTTEVETGVPFFDHMLAQLGKHGCIDLIARTHGDTDIDAHHTVEDTALALGQALREALGDKAGITRFGDALVPLDETLVQAAVDLSRRPSPPPPPRPPSPPTQPPAPPRPPPTTRRCPATSSSRSQ